MAANNHVVLEDVRLLFRNFSGEPDKYDRKGSPKFSVALSDEMAEYLEDLGFNVKWLQPKREDDVPQAYIQVKINFNGRPPRFVMIGQTSRSKTTLPNEEDIDILDHSDIVTSDVIIAPYHWEMEDGAKGVSAYVQSLYCTIREDELDLKYADYGE